MHASSPEKTPPGTPGKSDALPPMKALDRLSIQNEKTPHLASKRERATSAVGEWPNKQLHAAVVKQESVSPRKRSSRPAGHKQSQQKHRTGQPVQGPSKPQTHAFEGVRTVPFSAPVPKIAQPSTDGLTASKAAQSQSALQHPPHIHHQAHHGPNDVHRGEMPKSGRRPVQSTKAQRSGKHSSKPAEPPPPRFRPLMQSSTNTEYAGMLLQPDSSPISEAQLAAEIQGIYDGVVTVELKCMDIDAALARDTKTPLGLEQWQALIALHRTLLYEHHDFLMATQHPSASDDLRGLAMQYGMPARMWKHGIHAFLEVLRHRRPDSQDYMLAFVVLAYQMMALLYETVPCFTDTWIECLGDLARYRMAIEEDREMHAVWGGVAARWYTLASDRHPETGRLYHHLGILERPSMRKLTSYAKSLTCTVPFFNARDSLTTFCTPIVQEENLSKAIVGSAEAVLVTFFALVFLAREPEIIQSVAVRGLQLLLEQATAKTKEFGPQLALASIAAVFEFGSVNNELSQAFTGQRASRVSETAASGSNQSANVASKGMTTSSACVVDFYFACFNTLVRPQHSNEANSDVLGSVHVALAWFQCLHTLGARSQDQATQDTISALMDPRRFSWGTLCLFLNGLCQATPIEEGVLESARQGKFMASHGPGPFVALAEDYWMRGLQWAQLYLPSDLLPARADEIESPLSGAARIRRVQWLALSLALRTRYLKYDAHKKAFCASVQGPLAQPEPSRLSSVASLLSQAECAPSSRSTTWATQQSSAPTSRATSRSSTTVSTAEDSDGFTLVPRHRSKPQARSWAKVAAATPRKTFVTDQTVYVAEPDEEVR